MSWDSSIRIVSTDRTIEVRSPAGAKALTSSLCVQNNCVARSVSYPARTGSPFPRRTATPGRDALLLRRSWTSRSYTSSPPKRRQGVQRDSFTCTLTLKQECWAYILSSTTALKLHLTQVEDKTTGDKYSLERTHCKKTYGTRMQSRGNYVQRKTRTSKEEQQRTSNLFLG
jgi:hypothetical protein